MKHLPPVTAGIALISLFVFAYQSSLTGDQRILFILQWGAVPYEITVRDLPPTVPFPIAGTLLTALLLHSGLGHLAVNMTYLGLFGPPVERALGTWRFLALFLLCGIGAGVAQVAAFPVSMFPTIGASGALAGVMAAYVVLFPRVSPRTIVFGVWCVLQVMLALDTLNTVQQWTGGVAAWAHLAGTGLGVLLALLARRWAAFVGSERMPEVSGRAARRAV